MRIVSVPQQHALWLVVLLAALTSVSAVAEDTGRYRRCHAVIVGVNAYPQLPDEARLRFAVDDAEALRKTLTEEYGYLPGDIRLLTDKQATKKAVLNALYDLSDTKRVAAGDSVLFYFAGHGKDVGAGKAKQGFILPSDADVSLLDVDNPAPFYRTCISMEELTRVAAAIPARHKLFLMDACYSGLVIQTRALAAKEKKSGYVDRLLGLPSLQILTAGQADQQVVERGDLGHSAFCHKLLEALRSGGADDDMDNVILASELATYVKRQIGNLRVKQNPLYAQDGPGDFLFFRQGSTTSPPVDTQDLDALRRERERLAAERARFEAERLEGEKNDLAREAFALAEGYEQKTYTPQQKERKWLDYAEKWGDRHKGEFARKRAKHWADVALHQDYSEKTAGLDMDMAWIKGGTFEMGSHVSVSQLLRKFEGSKEEYFTGEHPLHTVTLDGFWMGRTEVTVDQFRRFVRATSYRTDAEKAGKARTFDMSSGEWKDTKGADWEDTGYFQSGSHPVVCVSWNDAKAFCDWLSRETGRSYALPSEAQWEYACRAGTDSLYHWGDDPDDGDGWGNLLDESANKELLKHGRQWTYRFGFDDGYVFTAPVGQFKRNDFGLYDMHGNALEWCEDWYDSNYYGGSLSSNPKGPSSGSYRVLRGGSWSYRPGSCRSASRGRDVPVSSYVNVGFRVVCISPGLK